MEIAVKQTGSLDETLVNDDLVRSPLGNWVCLHCRPNWLTLGHSVFLFFFCRSLLHSFANVQLIHQAFLISCGLAAVRHVSLPVAMF